MAAPDRACLRRVSNGTKRHKCKGPLSTNSIDLSAIDGGLEWGMKDGCPVSKLVNAKITLDATLAS
jgi:hypothetical protein